MGRGTRLLSDARRAGDRAMQKTLLTFLAPLALNDGDYQQLIEFYKQALALETADTVPYARALQNLALAYCGLNESRTCLEYRESAAAIYRAQGAVRDLAVILSQMSGTYESLGEWQAALRVSQEAGGEVAPVILAKTGQYALAVETARRTITRAHERGDATGEAGMWSSLAGIYADGNEPDRSLECLEEALRTYPAGARRLAQFRYAVGLGFLQLGYTERALELFHQFLNGGPDAESPNHAGMVVQIARAERDAGLLDDARAHVETALAEWDEQRSRIVSPELRASYGGKGINDLYIDVLMAQQDRAPNEGNDAQALAVSDRARAQILIANLGDTASRIREGVDPKLLEQEKALQRQFNRAATLQQSSGELKLLRGEIRQSSPRYASLTEPASLSLAEIREQVLGPDTLLLEYWLGEKRSFLWAVTPDSLHSFVLPGRVEIESAVRRVYDLLTAPRIGRKGETLAQNHERISRAETAYPAAAAALTRMIVGPAAGLLGGRRLLIVADGALAYVPFSALPDPKTREPLAVAHEIVHLPSASALAALRSEVAARGTAARRGIAVLADPVFAANDERLSADRGNASMTYGAEFQDPWTQ
jgi:tetratricopeptide (TPR) repeat protein